MATYMATYTVPTRLALAATAVLALAVAACSSSGATAAPSAPASAAPASAAASAASGAMTVTGAWMRPSPMVAGADAAYFVMTNGTGQDDALVSVSSPISATVEIHETYTVQSTAMPAASGGTMPATTSGGVIMLMRPVDSIPIAAGATVELKPGSYHIMIIDPKEQPATGTTVELTLTFQKAPPVTVMAEVRGQ